MEYISRDVLERFERLYDQIDELKFKVECLEVIVEALSKGSDECTK